MDTGSKVTEGKDFKTDQTGVAMGNLKVKRVSGAEIDMEMLAERKVLPGRDKIGDLAMTNFLATHLLVSG